jgi:hypothetical protein
MNRDFSKAQLNYATARAAFDVAYSAARKYDLAMDAECEKLGIETPYGILPDGHPMWDRAQQLLNAENEAKELMYKAAHQLFDWATSETFKRCGTPAQHEQIMEMVAKVKKMAFVEKPFEELVSMSMRLHA